MDLSEIKAGIIGITGYSEAGLLAQLDGLINSEISTLCTVPIPISGKYAGLTVETMRDTVLPATIGTLFGVLPNPSTLGIQPIMWIRTEAHELTAGGLPKMEKDFNSPYMERRLISVISVGRRLASAFDKACFLLAGFDYNISGVLLDSSLVYYPGLAPVPTPGETEILNYRPVDHESIVVAEDMRHTYAGLAGSIETYTAIAKGPPTKCALAWNFPPYMVGHPITPGTQPEEQMASMGASVIMAGLQGGPLQRAHLLFWPPPDDDYGIRVYYRRRPDPLVNPTDENIFTRTYPWMLINRMAAKILRGWIGNDARAEMFAVVADEELLNLVVHAEEFGDISGTTIAPGESRYGKMRGIGLT